MRTLCSRSPPASTSDTVAQPASRYPPRIGAIPPSSETTTARAASATSTLASLYRCLERLALRIQWTTPRRCAVPRPRWEPWGDAEFLLTPLHTRDYTNGVIG